VAGDYPDLLRPTSLAEAIAQLEQLGEDGAPLAGCTWVMRAPSRGERLRRTYVSLQDLDELLVVAEGDSTAIGARVTHAELGRLDGNGGPLGALAEAARRSANRAVRNVATLGGNLCSTPFPASDLVPALLASEASVELEGSAGGTSVELSEFLARRHARPASELVCSVRVPCPAGRRSWYERLTVRGSSEYPIAGVAVSLDLAEDATIAAARVAVGGVEDVARRVPEAEVALNGRPLSPAAGEEAGREASTAMSGRDAVDAPGWYRLAVLPTLTRQAVAALAEERP
jgi:carbon-monoxide dehydrogenase medium subunit